MRKGPCGRRSRCVAGIPGAGVVGGRCNSTCLRMPERSPPLVACVGDAWRDHSSMASYDLGDMRRRWIVWSNVSRGVRGMTWRRRLGRNLRTCWTASSRIARPTCWSPRFRRPLFAGGDAASITRMRWHEGSVRSWVSSASAGCEPHPRHGKRPCDARSACGARDWPGVARGGCRRAPAWFWSTTSGRRAPRSLKPENSLNRTEPGGSFPRLPAFEMIRKPNFGNGLQTRDSHIRRVEAVTSCPQQNRAERGC